MFVFSLIIKNEVEILTDEKIHVALNIQICLTYVYVLPAFSLNRPHIRVILIYCLYQNIWWHVKCAYLINVSICLQWRWFCMKEFMIYFAHSHLFFQNHHSVSYFVLLLSFNNFVASYRFFATCNVMHVKQHTQLHAHNTSPQLYRVSDIIHRCLFERI